MTKQLNGIYIVAGELIKQTPELFYLYSISMSKSIPHILAHAYTKYSWQSKALIHPHFGLSDHISLLLLPTYSQLIKKVKPSVQMVRLDLHLNRQCGESAGFSHSFK